MQIAEMVEYMGGTLSYKPLFLAIVLKCIYNGLAMSRLDGIGMGLIMITDVGFVCFLIFHYFGFEGGTHSK